ncbi:MAG TPA: zinc ribbon domain-containing protein [Syntrophorhabdaceae bacterium]|nr:zinc ribbon domain-containing protein [Syntrophorhabdaceae bacterium]
MVGIISYGGYIPLWRLSRSAIAAGLKGEKAIAGFDEDSITMAVAAAAECLKGVDRNDIDALILCSTTLPYVEKQSAAILARALDLRKDILTTDITGCLRGGTIGLRIALDMVKSGSAKNVLIAAADCRLGVPESGVERESGDGAAAFLIGETEKPVATVKGQYSVSSELMDVWRSNGETFINTEEDRFIEDEGYLKIVGQAVKGLFSSQGLSAKDFAKAAFYAPSPRCYQALPGTTGLKLDQIQDPLFGKVGNTGTAHALMLLAAALEGAKIGDRLLVASYGDGSDALMLEVNGPNNNGQRTFASYMDNKKIVEDYRRYLKWRGILPLDKSRATVIPKVSMKALMRRQEELLSMNGVKCRACGTVQYPPQRVCTKCRTKDEFDKVRLSDKKGVVYSWSADFGAGGMELPIPTMTDVEGGGRVFCILCDASQEEAKVGMPVEFTLRRGYSQAPPDYIWKAKPAITAE